MSATELQVLTLTQMTSGEEWRLGLAHDKPYHALFWFTHGQGRILLEGRRRGLGPHNAVFIPAGSLFSVDLGRQSLGQVVTIPVGTPLRLPDMPRHLRVLDGQVQSELSAIIDGAQRKQSVKRPLYQDAMEAHFALMSVWLRRQIALEEHVPAKRSAGERLSRDFVRLISQHYTSGASMVFYAKELGVTPTHLTRVVKQATGKTAAELLTERVVYAARLLLGETGHPARNIAQHLGFGSAAYFTRFMQQHTGMTPTRLRKTATTAAQTPKPLLAARS